MKITITNFIILFFIPKNFVLQQIVLKSMEFDNPNFSANGYISLCLVYVVFAITNMLTPSVVSFLGSKLTLISASTVYTLFIANLIITTNWSLYLSSVALGLAAAMLWTAQGNYLTLMSNPETISRNTGIFWVFFCCRYRNQKISKQN